MTQTDNEARKAAREIANEGPEKIPAVATTSWHDKHSGHSFRCAVTKEDGEWTTAVEPRDGEQKYEFVDAPEEWQKEWDERRDEREKWRKAKKNIMDALKLPIMDCPVCGADSNDIYDVSNTNVKEAAHGSIPSYEDWGDYPVQFCSKCECNFIKRGDYKYSSRRIFSDVFDREAPKAGISTHFSMSQDRKKHRLMEGPETYREDVEEFIKELQEVREAVDADHKTSWEKELGD